MEKQQSEVSNQLSAKDFALYLGCYCRYRTHNLKLNAVANEEDQPLPLVLEDEVFELQGIKPILRPLSDMSAYEWREIFSDPNATDQYAESKIALMHNSRYDLFQVLSKLDPGDALEDLLNHHFDLFGWIDAGLAIDATTLNPNPYKEQ